MGKEFCAVSLDLNRFERQQGVEAERSASEERREAEVKERALVLLAGEFNQLLPDCISEALGEADKDDFNLHLLADLLSSARFEEAGKLVVEISTAYWTKRAHERADDELFEQEELARNDY